MLPLGRIGVQLPRVRRLLFIPVLVAVALASAAGAVATAAVSPVPTHMLSVDIAGTGSGTINGGSVDCFAQAGAPVGPCSVSDESGSRVTLTASAAKGSVFAGWSGGCTGTGSCSVTLNSNVTVTAKFTLAAVSAKSGTLAVSSSRTASLAMTCRGPGTCNGTIAFSTMSNGRLVQLASAKYNIAKGRTTHVTLRFSSSAVTLITKAHKKLKATQTILPNEAQPVTSKRTLTLA